MAVFLSLLTAALFGTGDFCGGLAAKRTSVVQVVLGSHLVGLVGVFIASLVMAERFLLGDLVLGMVGGAFGAMGVGLLYRGLARGPMGVVAPLTAMTSAAAPAAWGVGFGDELSGWAWVGIVLAVLAIGLVSSTSSAPSSPVTGQVIVEALMSGVGFGAFFIVIDATDAASAPWPVVGARLLTTVGIGFFVLVTAGPGGVQWGGATPLIALTGVFDTGSNVLFLYATHEGLLSVVAVLSSLYPITTVMLARLVLNERLTRLQLWGFLAAMAATVLIAAG
ncbi:MAG: DMT family transporter [Actinomycetia bacterium]|nr:DMT family transporter [Actinomycetes bacterium]